MTAKSAPSSSDPVTTQGGSDTALGDLVLAVEALGIDAEQHLDAMARPLCHLGCGHSPVEPSGQACVAKVVRSTRKLRVVLIARQCSLARLLPCPPVGDSGQRAALDSLEEGIYCLTGGEGEVVAEQSGQPRRARDTPRLTFGSVLESSPVAA